MPMVEFEGVTHNFPDDWDNKTISRALQSFSTATPPASTERIPRDNTPEKEEGDVVAFAIDSPDTQFKEENMLPPPPKKQSLVDRMDASLQAVFADLQAQQGQVPDLETQPQTAEQVLTEQHVRPELDETGDGVVDEPVETTLVPLTKEQETFRAAIQKIETGGLDNEWIRTKVVGSASTAYGTYQITRGLLRGYLNNKRSLFTEEEQGAMEQLIRRQSIAIAIGGKDRTKYESGGKNHAQAKLWQKEFGYASVGDMLDAFDYGGDYGLTEDVDFQTQYENFARKMLIDHIKLSKGNTLDAASVWHGGTNWKKGKHRKQTDVYRRKYETYTKPTE